MIRLSKRMGSAYVDKKKEDSGNITYIYDEKHIKKRNRQKEAKVKRLEKSISDLRDKVREDLKSDNVEKRLAAVAIGLIDDTYERVGNDDSAEQDHYGVTTWKVKHVTFSGNKARIKYVGKSGVKQDKEVKQKSLVTALKDLVKDKKKDDKIFEVDDFVLTANEVNKYLKRFRVTAKDIRGYHANSEMRKALKSARKGKLPSDEKEKTKKLKDEFKKALEDTANKVGHEPGTLKNQYLVHSIEEDYMNGKFASFALSKRYAQELAPKAPGAQILIEPYDSAVAQALAKLPPDIKNNITKVVVHPEGGPGQLGHVEMGPGKDPREVHVFKSRINEQVRRMFGTTQPTPQQLEEATQKALTETLIHEGVHIGPEKTQEQILNPAYRFRDESGTQTETERHFKRVFPSMALDASLKLDDLREKFFPSQPMTEPDLEFTVYCALNKRYNMVKKGIALLRDPDIHPMALEIEDAIQFNKRLLANSKFARMAASVGSGITHDGVLHVACWQASNGLTPTGKIDRATLAKLGKMVINRDLPRNFGIVVPDRLFRGGMIDNPLQLKALKDHFGVQRVISLHNNPDIGRMCTELGIEHIPAPIETGASHEYGRKILGNRISELLLEKPTYVHCWFGADRTGGVIARFRTETGWDNNDAYREAKSYGFKDMFADLIDWFSEVGNGPPPVDTKMIRRRHQHHSNCPYTNPETTGEDDIIKEWVEENVKSSKDNCFFYAGVLALLFPNLKLIKGKPQLEGETAHFWVENDGQIIDPTENQYDKPIDYSDGKPVNILKNVDFIVSDKLFKTLPKEDQKKIKNLVPEQDAQFSPTPTPTDEPFRNLSDTWPRYERWSDTIRSINPMMTMTPPAPIGSTGQ